MAAARKAPKKGSPRVRKGNHAGLTHTRDNETAAWWMSQIEEAQQVYGEVYRHPGHFREQLRNALCLSEHRVSSSGDGLMYHAIARWTEWLRSEAYDDTPEETVQGGGVDVNEFVETLCEVTYNQTGEAIEYRSGIDDVVADGISVMWYGVDEEFTSADILAGRRADPADIAEEVAMRVKEPGLPPYKPTKGQDHERIYTVLEEQANDPMLMAGPLGEEISAALLMAAALHREQEEEDAEDPKSARYKGPRVRLWSKRELAGLGVVWDPAADDIDNARWVARRIVMDVDVARANPAWKPGARRKLMPGTYEELDDSRIIASEQDSLQRSPADLMCLDTVVWEVYDRKWEEVLYVAHGLEESLEKDRSDPNGGKLRHLGFVPYARCVPYQTKLRGTLRAFGRPAGAIGWKLQNASDRVLRYLITICGGLSQRIYQFLTDVDPDTRKKIEDGEPVVFIDAPAGWAEQQRPFMQLVPYHSVPPHLFSLVDLLRVRLAEVLAWPLSQMTGAPQSNTATGEEVAFSAGKGQMNDLIRELQAQHARGQQIKMALIQAHYSKANVTDLVDEKYLTPRGENGELPSVWDEFKATPMTSLTFATQFTSTAQNDDPQRRAQVRQALEFLLMLPGPAPGLPKYGGDALDPLIRQFLKLHRLDEPRPAGYTEEQVMLAFGVGAEGEGGGGAPPSGPKKGDGQDATWMPRGQRSAAQKGAALGGRPLAR